MSKGSTLLSDKHAKGFTYLWVLFSVAFMGVGMMLFAQLWSTSVKRERELELIWIGRSFRDAIGRYYESTPGLAKQYPLSLDDLLKDPRFPGTRRHLRKLYIDPMTGKPEWGVVRVAGRIAGIYSLSQDAPMKKARFDLTETSFEGREKYTEWQFVYPQNLLIKPAVNVTSKAGSGTQGMSPNNASIANR